MSANRIFVTVIIITYFPKTVISWMEKIQLSYADYVTTLYQLTC